jgi:hypothetical protein
VQYSSLITLQRDGKITINGELKYQLKGESPRRRSYDKSSLLNAELIEAAKQLKNNDNIIIRKADKANIFVILNKADYISKVNELLGDNNKFRNITRDPTETL